MKEEAQRIWKKVYKYFLQGRDLLKHPKKRTNTSLRIVCKKEDKRKLVFEYHEGPWEGHRGVWVTFSKIKGKYWWPRHSLLERVKVVRCTLNGW